MMGAPGCTRPHLTRRRVRLCRAFVANSQSLVRHRSSSLFQKPRLMAQSPHDLESFVKVEHVVRWHEGEVFCEGLRDDPSIEWIRVMGGQIEQVKGTPCRVWED